MLLTIQSHLLRGLKGVMVIVLVDKYQVVGQRCTCRQISITRRSEERSRIVPRGIKKTMAWGARNTLVILCIDIVLGRIDAPLGAERVYFGIKSGWEQGNVLTNIGRGIEGLGFNIAFVVGENVEARAAARLVFSKANIRPVVQPEELPWKFTVGADHIVACRHSGGCSDAEGVRIGTNQTVLGTRPHFRTVPSTFCNHSCSRTVRYIKNDSRPRHLSELGGFRAAQRISWTRRQKTCHVVERSGSKEQLRTREHTRMQNTAYRRQ